MGAKLVRAIRACLAQAGLEGEDIGGIVASGSWTTAGQQGEHAALAAVFGEKITSVRSTIEKTRILPASGPLVVELLRR